MTLYWSDGNDGKSYVSKAAKFVKNHGDGIYICGALGTLALSYPFMQKHADVFMGLPWQELTPNASLGFEAIGLGQAGQVARDFQKGKEQGIKPHPLEYAGRGLRPATLAAYPLALATHNDARFALVLPAALTIAGYALESAGKWLRERKEAKLKGDQK